MNPRTADHKGEEATLGSKGARIAVVDDDLAMRRSIRALLESVGMQVETFEGGAAFVKVCEREPFNCLVLDQRLPDISGLQLIKRVKERQGYCPPVIIISGHGDVPTVVHAFKAGVVDFLEKPFRPQDLIEQVQKAVELDRAMRDAHRRRERAERALSALSKREKQVLQMLLGGMSNKHVSLQLGLSDKTVATHRSRILVKFGVQSLLELSRLLDWLKRPEAAVS